MLSNMINTKLDRNTVPGIIFFLAFFNLFFINNLDGTIYFILRNGAAAIATLYILFYIILNIGVIIKSRIVLAVGAYSLVVLISSYINLGITIQAFIYAVNIFNMFTAAYICGLRNSIHTAINLVKWYFIILCLINDIYMIFLPGIEWEQTYFLGNKFSVSYDHFILLCLLLSSLRRKKYYTCWFILGSLFVFLISYFTDCMTMVIGTGFMIVVYFIIKVGHIKSSRGSVVLIGMGLSFLFIYIAKPVLESAIGQAIITNLLGREGTFGSRIVIYDIVLPAIYRKFLFGYGFTNNMFQLVGSGVPNTQNGLLDIISYYGIIGALLYVYILYLCLKDKCINYNNIMLLISIYVLIFMGTVEITYTSNFLMLAALFSAFKNVKKTSSKKEKTGVNEVDGKKSFQENINAF